MKPNRWQYPWSRTLVSNTVKCSHYFINLLGFKNLRYRSSCMTSVRLYFTPIIIKHKTLVYLTKVVTTKSDDPSSWYSHRTKTHRRIAQTIACRDIWYFSFVSRWRQCTRKCWLWSITNVNCYHLKRLVLSNAYLLMDW